MSLRASLLSWLVVGSPLALAAQTSTNDSITTVTAGPEFEARPLRRVMAGAGYRDLWLTPIRVPILDLAHTGGGLTPIDTDGGSRRIVLHMTSASGDEYDLVPVDPAPIMKMVCGDCANRALNVLTSAANPAAELMAAPLLDAAGLPTLAPRLVVIPNDPRLGPYRREFAGVLCVLEKRPASISTDSMSRVVSQSASDHIDARAYLTARLMDMYMGDWNRGPTQWRWFPAPDVAGGRRWEPIPMDHRAAFQRADGVLTALGRQAHPELIAFGDHYPSLWSLTSHEWALDRRLLQSLDRSTYDSVARALERSLTDPVIGGSIAAMPPEYRELRGSELVQALQGRRQRLPALADQYYRLLALGADVHSKALPTTVDITRSRDTVSVRLGGYFERRFPRSETAEIRLYLEGDPDSVRIRGGDDGIKLRLIADRERTVVVDSGSGKTRIYDRHWTPPPGSGQVARDAGGQCHQSRSLNAGSGAGGVFGISITCEAFGFRRLPWAYSNTFGIGYQTAAGGGVADYRFQIRPIESRSVVSLHLLAISSRFQWFYGEGNATSSTDTAFGNGVRHGEPDFRIRESFFEVAPGYTMPFGDYTSLTLSPELRYWQTARMGRYVDSVRPYGVGPFGEVGGLLDAEYDSRDHAGYPTRGIDVKLTGRGVPALWSAVSSFGTLRGSVATYLTPPIFPLHPTLALRVGGDKVWGNAPYQELAYAGGPAYAGGDYAIRGSLPQRYAGQAAAFANVQLEVPLVRTRILTPVTLGVLALNDVGRVFVPNETDAQWHDGAGGGIFVTPAGGSTLSLAVVHSADGTRAYFGTGIGF